MTNITIAVPAELHAKMKGLTEVRWSEIARKAFEDKIRDYEIIDAFAKHGKFTQKDVEEFADLIDKRAWKKINKECA